MTPVRKETEVVIIDAMQDKRYFRFQSSVELHNVLIDLSEPWHWDEGDHHAPTRGNPGQACCDPREIAYCVGVCGPKHRVEVSYYLRYSYHSVILSPFFTTIVQSCANPV